MPSLHKLAFLAPSIVAAADKSQFVDTADPVYTTVEEHSHGEKGHSHDAATSTFDIQKEIDTPPYGHWKVFEEGPVVGDFTYTGIMYGCDADGSNPSASPGFSCELLPVEGNDPRAKKCGSADTPEVCERIIFDRTAGGKILQHGVQTTWSKGDRGGPYYSELTGQIAETLDTILFFDENLNLLQEWRRITTEAECERACPTNEDWVCGVTETHIQTYKNSCIATCLGAQETIPEKCATAPTQRNCMCDAQEQFLPSWITNRFGNNMDGKALLPNAGSSEITNGEDPNVCKPFSIDGQSITKQLLCDADITGKHFVADECWDNSEAACAGPAAAYLYVQAQMTILYKKAVAKRDTTNAELASARAASAQAESEKLARDQDVITVQATHNASQLKVKNDMSALATAQQNFYDASQLLQGKNAELSASQVSLEAARNDLANVNIQTNAKNVNLMAAQINLRESSRFKVDGVTNVDGVTSGNPNAPLDANKNVLPCTGTQNDINGNAFPVCQQVLDNIVSKVETTQEGEQQQLVTKNQDSLAAQTAVIATAESAEATAVIAFNTANTAFNSAFDARKQKETLLNQAKEALDAATTVRDGVARVLAQTQLVAANAGKTFYTAEAAEQRAHDAFNIALGIFQNVSQKLTITRSEAELCRERQVGINQLIMTSSDIDLANADDAVVAQHNGAFTKTGYQEWLSNSCQYECAKGDVDCENGNQNPDAPVFTESIDPSEMTVSSGVGYDIWGCPNFMSLYYCPTTASCYLPHKHTCPSEQGHRPRMTCDSHMLSGVPQHCPQQVIDIKANLDIVVTLVNLFLTNEQLVPSGTNTKVAARTYEDTKQKLLAAVKKAHRDIMAVDVTALNANHEMGYSLLALVIAIRSDISELSKLIQRVGQPCQANDDASGCPDLNTFKFVSLLSQEVKAFEWGPTTADKCCPVMKLMNQVTQKYVSEEDQVQLGDLPSCSSVAIASRNWNMEHAAECHKNGLWNIEKSTTSSIAASKNGISVQQRVQRYYQNSAKISQGKMMVLTKDKEWEAVDANQISTFTVFAEISSFGADKSVQKICCPTTVLVDFTRGLPAKNSESQEPHGLPQCDAMAITMNRSAECPPIPTNGFSQNYPCVQNMVNYEIASGSCCAMPITTCATGAYCGTAFFPDISNPLAIREDSCKKDCVEEKLSLETIQVTDQGVGCCGCDQSVANALLDSD